MRPTLGAKLNSVAVHIGRALRKREGPLGLEQRSALSVIAFAGPLRMGDLARTESVSAPAITRTVDILERAGLVRRERDRRDSRATLVAATAKGRALVFRGRDERARRIDRALGQLSPAAVRRIRASVEDLEELVGALDMDVPGVPAKLKTSRTASVLSRSDSD